MDELHTLLAKFSSPIAFRVAWKHLQGSRNRYDIEGNRACLRRAFESAILDWQQLQALVEQRDPRLWAKLPTWIIDADGGEPDADKLAAQVKLVFGDVLADKAETPAPPKKGRTPGRNDKRDAWLYKECCKTPLKLLKTILSECNKRFPDNRLNSTHAINGAMFRYCKKHDLPPIPYRKTT